jgi:hypothetical protein
VAQVGGVDANGQFYQLENMKVQVLPKDRDQLKYNSKFVHVIVDSKVQAPCSAAPVKALSASEWKTEYDRHYFSNFELTDTQLAMAGPALMRGSNSFMLYFRSANIGLAFDSKTNTVIGVDIPKKLLRSDFVFTATTGDLDMNEIPPESLFPLMIEPEDLKLHRRAAEISKELTMAIDESKDEDKQKQDLDLYWYELFNK